MSLTNYKLTDAAIARDGVVSAPDKLTGSAAQNKMVFDRLIHEAVKGLHNGLIDALASSGGAGEIGTAQIEGVAGEDVQTVLENLKTILDTKSADADMSAALALKSNKSVTDRHIKSVNFDPLTGVFLFMREDGSYFTIDTMLEKLATNWSYDASTQSLVLTLLDGTTQRVPLSAFITETEFLDSGQIAFSLNNHRVTATVKPGSITDSMLASTLVTQLQGYVSAASDSATNAEQQKNAASGSAASAALSASSASDSAASASGSATSAAGDASSAADSAEEAKEWAIGQDRDGRYVQQQNAFAYSTIAGIRSAAAETAASGASDSAASASGSAASASASAASASASATSAAASASAAATDAANAEHFAQIAASVADLNLSVVDGKLCQTYTT